MSNSKRVKNTSKLLSGKLLITTILCITRLQQMGICDMKAPKTILWGDSTWVVQSATQPQFSTQELTDLKALLISVKDTTLSTTEHDKAKNLLTKIEGLK